MKLRKVTTDLLSDSNMERAFFTSALLGIGSIVVPFLAPVALTGMVTSQSIFWGKRLSGQSKDSN